MGQIHSRESLQQEIALLYKHLMEAGDERTADKASALVEKCQAGDVYIAFCGHFSAGKSSLINALCGTTLLPSSPIPTSANIVSIRSGDAEARIRYRDGRTESVPLTDVSSHAKDGGAVETVELMSPIELLGDRGVLLDTPGVDSTDDAHRLSTESALHMADIVFYVMDYNHVLSEMNMDFAKQLSEMGKPLILVVNQIDKHRETEVPFGEFRNGVSDAFRAWGVEPAAVFYSTLKSPNHPHNELRLLRRFLAELVNRGEALSISGLASAALQLPEEHGAVLDERSADRKASLRELARREDESAYERYDALRKELERRSNIASAVEEQAAKEIGKIADNSNLTPATTRDLAQSFLESRQSGFKVGFLFTGAKTEEERGRRLQALYADFREQVTTQLVWHVRDWMKRLGASLGVPYETAERLSDAIDAEISPEWLLGMVRPGAAATGEYTLNYSREIGGEARQMVRRTAVKAAAALASEAHALYAAEEPGIRAELAELEAQLANRRELEALEATERGAVARLTALLPTAAAIVREPEPFPDAAALAKLEPAELDAPKGAPSESAAAGALNLSRYADRSAANAWAAAGEPAYDVRLRFGEAADALVQAASSLAGIAPLAATTRTLQDKSRRLREQRFTAALFGAFSAGKSSFANALLGEAALPVSPNPTTAAINTVVPPTPEWPHGTAKVTMKSYETIVSDIRHSLESLGQPLEGAAFALETLLQKLHKIEKSNRGDVPPGGKPHLAFLKAVANGWKDAEPLLGTEVRADREQFRAYVAEERKSAFVDRIELYYESALSKQGVTLVDTPGADSINARHTGVAFNYIKNADAIFFVTYYNHAFSRADRQFLEQLGRVKDTFELDKMFFIVNAADLASSPEELDDVLAHVESNLLSFGIRHPRLFPVSSLGALQGRSDGDTAAVEASGMTAFETEFTRFAGVELATLAFESAKEELKRALGQLDGLLSAARTGDRERESALKRLAAGEQEARGFLQTADFDSVRKETAKEIAEQFYYMKQRMMFRFGEWYQISFNPASLREDRADVKESLQWAWRDLVNYMRAELVNEVLALSLRMERHLNKLLRQTNERWEERLRKHVSGYDSGPWEEMSFPTPDVNDVWTGEEPDAKLLSAHYRSAKQFFEGEGRKTLRDVLEKRWQGPVVEALERESERFAAWYEVLTARSQDMLTKRAEEALSDTVSGMRAAMDNTWDAADLERRSEQVRKQLEPFQAGKVEITV